MTTPTVTHEVVIRPVEGCPGAVCSCGRTVQRNTVAEAAAWGVHHLAGRA